MDSPEKIERIRVFNRTVTRRIGVLDDRFLGRGRPLAQSRLLYEIGDEGLEIRTLRNRLGLDSGYVSRLLRSLERQGLVRVETAPGDRRVRYARLSKKGRSERAELDRRSDASARALLAHLDEGQQARLVEAMCEVKRLLLLGEIVIGPEPADGSAASECLRAYYDLLTERFEEGYDPGRAQPADSADFAPPDGVFLIARSAGAPVGCGGLKTAAAGIGEIKRLWVAEASRGLGLGQRLLDALERHARALGLDVLRLDTNRTLTEAQALYRKNGYVEVPPFNDDPYPDHWFEKRLV